MLYLVSLSAAIPTFNTVKTFHFYEYNKLFVLFCWYIAKEELEVIKLYCVKKADIRQPFFHFPILTSITEIALNINSTFAEFDSKNTLNGIILK